jgi:hypothetical protein
MTLKSFAIATTTTAEMENATWPSFTLMNFHELGKQFVKQSHAEALFISPIITSKTEDAWNTYSAANMGWYKTGMTLEGRNETAWDDFVPPTQGIHWHPTVEEGEFSLELLQEADNVTHYLPLWQCYPVPNSPAHVNHNLIAFPTFNKLFHHLIETGEPVLSEIFTANDFWGPIIPSVDKDVDHSTNPHVMLLQPVLDSIENTTKVVAILGSIFQLDVYVENLLHEGADGIYLVFHNSCNDTVTYELFGPTPDLVGFGDLHDPKYEFLHATANFEPFPWHNEEENLSNINCHYQIDFYPGSIMYEEYHTNKPLILTVTVVLIFVLTSCAFFLYDRLVQVRQAKVLDTAQRTNAIVSSLFPAEVRDRLFKHKTKKDKKKNRKSVPVLASFPEGPKFRLKNYLNDETLGGEAKTAKDAESDSAKMNEREADAPIADLFPEVTVSKSLMS